MAAPPAARAVLFPVFAFNLELSRAAGASKESLIAEMRLQWWRDLLTGNGPVPAHEVGGPLMTLIRAQALDPAPLLDAVEARRQDIYGEGFTELVPLLDYLNASTAGLLWFAARALGEDPAHEAAFRRAALAGAVANYLQAVPALVAHGVPVPTSDLRRELAVIGQGHWQAARTHAFTAGKPVLRSLWQSPAILRQNASDPDTALRQSEFARRGRLLWLTWRNSW